MTALPALYRFFDGREVILARAVDEAIADGATGFTTPHAPTWPAISVAAGDCFDRGGIKEVVMAGVTDHGGTLHLVAHEFGGTAISGTIASLAMTADTPTGTVVTLSGTVTRMSTKFVNSAGGAAALSAEVRGRA